MAKRKDKTTVEKLTHVLRSDSFYGVRIAASRALRGISTDAAFEALAGSTKQPNAKVRSQVVSDIASQPKPGALPHLKRLLDSEKIRRSGHRSSAAWPATRTGRRTD